MFFRGVHINRLLISTNTHITCWMALWELIRQICQNYKVGEDEMQTILNWWQSIFLSWRSTDIIYKGRSSVFYTIKAECLNQFIQQKLLLSYQVCYNSNAKSFALNILNYWKPVPFKISTKYFVPGFFLTERYYQIIGNKYCLSFT